MVEKDTVFYLLMIFNQTTIKFLRSDLEIIKLEEEKAREELSKKVEEKEEEILLKEI